MEYNNLIFGKCNSDNIIINIEKELQEFINHFRDFMKNQFNINKFTIFGEGLHHILNPYDSEILVFDVIIYEDFKYFKKLLEIPSLNIKETKIIKYNKNMVKINNENYTFDICFYKELPYHNFEYYKQELTWDITGEIKGWKVNATYVGLHEIFKNETTWIKQKNLIPTEDNDISKHPLNLYNLTKILFSRNIPKINNIEFNEECCICNEDYNYDKIKSNINLYSKYIRLKTSCNHYICIKCLSEQCKQYKECYNKGFDGVTVKTQKLCPMCREPIKFDTVQKNDIIKEDLPIIIIKNILKKYNYEDKIDNTNCILDKEEVTLKEIEKNWNTVSDSCDDTDVIISI